MILIINTLTRGITTALCIALLCISSHLCAQGTEDENAHYELAQRIFKDGLYADAARGIQAIHHQLPHQQAAARRYVARWTGTCQSRTIRPRTRSPSTIHRPLPRPHRRHYRNARTRPCTQPTWRTHPGWRSLSRRTRGLIPPRQTRPRTSYQPERTTTKAAPYQKLARPFANSPNNIPNHPSSTKPPSTWAASSLKNRAPKKPSYNFAPSPNIPVPQSANPTPLLEMGNIALSRDNLSEAERIFANLRARYPATLAAQNSHLIIGAWHAGKDDWTSAEKTYNNALVKIPNKHPAPAGPCWEVQMQNANSAKAKGRYSATPHF